tara:strand:- start:75 stop:467 length:393 start_codon:yes stop_codon:yes gene_type:complete
MLEAIKSSVQILIIGFLTLPCRIWINSKNKLIQQYNRKETIYEILDDEYMATNWLDWAIDCVIFMIYPMGLLIISAIMCFSDINYFILIALIPLYFSTLFISIARELGGSFMLLHINVKKIEKYIRSNNK